jgi:capsule polysaccharide export protein KpsE/RkpR
LAVSDALAEFETAWDRVARTIYKIRLLQQQLQQQRETRGATRRIKRSLESAEATYTERKLEYDKADRALDAALKRLPGEPGVH